MLPEPVLRSDATEERLCEGAMLESAIVKGRAGERRRARLGRACVTAFVSMVAAALVGCGPAPGYEAEAETPANRAVAPLAPRDDAFDQSVVGTSAYRPTRPVADVSDGQNLAAATGPTGVSTDGETSDVEIGANGDEYADTDPSALTDFKPALDGHGTWVDDSTYGTVWVPSSSEVGTDFTPYVTAGRWTYDDTDNWVWVSDYSWGWAPFHYGRWTRVHQYGWVWIPGRTYAGAWVVWRTPAVGYDYVGWAPAPPDWYWYNGYAVAWTFGWSPYYSYCHHQYLYDPYVGRNVVYGPAYESRTVPYRQSAPPAGRVAASPSVGGRVAASPGVGGRAVASPRVVGPSPSELGIQRTAVPLPPTKSVALERAKAFASPRTTIAAGGGSQVRVKPRPLAADAVAGVPSRVSRSTIDPIARAPQYANVVPSGPHPTYARPSSSAALPDLTQRASRYNTTPGITAPNLTAPSGATSAHASSALVPRTQPYSSVQTLGAGSTRPSIHIPDAPNSGPVYRSQAPMMQPSISAQQPMIRPSAPTVMQPRMSEPRVSMPTPSYRPSVPIVQQAPMVHSSPSIAAPRVSAPTRSYSSSTSIRRR